MAWKYNGIYKLCEVLTVMLLALPIINAENIDCYGKSFHCVNSTHFMICVDIGGSSSSTVDNFIIECPPSTECHISNHYECEFPSSIIPTTNLQSGGVANVNEFGYDGVTTMFPWESIDTTMILTPKYDERPYGNLQDIRAGKSAYIESYIDTPTIKPKYAEYSKITTEGTVTPTVTPSTFEPEYFSQFNDGKHTTPPNYDDITVSKPVLTNQNDPETNTEVTPRLTNVIRDFTVFTGQDTVNNFENYIANINHNNWESTISTNSNTIIEENKNTPLNVFDKMSDVEFIQSKPESHSGSLQISQKYSQTPVSTKPTYAIKINTEGILNNTTEYGDYNTSSTIGVTNHNIDIIPITETPLTTENNEFLNILLNTDVPVLPRSNATDVNREESIKNSTNVTQILTPDNLASVDKEAGSTHLYDTDLLEIIKVKSAENGKDLKKNNDLDIVDKNKQLNLSNVVENYDETGLTKMLYDLINIKEFDDTVTNISKLDSPTSNKNNLYNTTISDLKNSFNLTEMDNANIEEIEKVKSLPILIDSVVKNNTQTITDVSGTLETLSTQHPNISATDTYNLSNNVKEGRNSTQLRDEHESALDMDEQSPAEIALILNNNTKLWFEEMHEKRQEILSELESKNTSNFTVLDKNQVKNRGNTKVIKKTFTMEPVFGVHTSISPYLDTQESSIQSSNGNKISNSNLSLSIDNANFNKTKMKTPSNVRNTVNSSDYSQPVEGATMKPNKTLRETRSNSELENPITEANTMSPDNENLIREIFDKETILNENSTNDSNKEKLASFASINESNNTQDKEKIELTSKTAPGTKYNENLHKKIVDHSESENFAKKTVDEEANDLIENPSDHFVAEQANITEQNEILDHYLFPHSSTPGLDIITLNLFDENTQTRPTRTFSPEINNNITENAASSITSNKKENITTTDDVNLKLSSRVQNVSSLVQDSKNSSTAKILPSLVRNADWLLKNTSSYNKTVHQNINNGYSTVTSTVTATPTTTPSDNTTSTATPDLPTANTNEQTHSTWTPSSTATTSSSDSFTKEVSLKKLNIISNLTNKTTAKLETETKPVNTNYSQKTPKDERVSKTNNSMSDQKESSAKSDMKMKKIIDILLESLFFSNNDKLANNQNNMAPKTSYNNEFTQTATFTPTSTQTNTETYGTTAQTTPSVTFDPSTSYTPTSTNTLPTLQREHDASITHSPTHYYNRQTAQMAVMTAGGLPMFTTTAMSESASYGDFQCPRNVRGKFADKHNCRVYYTCFGDPQPVIGICPRYTVFSEVNKLCSKNLSHCMKYYNFKCNSAGRFSDFIKNNIYYICVKAAGMKSFYKLQFQCARGYRLEKKTVKCVIDHSGNGNDPASSTEELSNSKSDLVAQESRQITSVYKKKHSHRPFQCVEEGYFADPSDRTCRVYYECKKRRNKFRQVKRKCESDELFDKDSESCVDAESYECGSDK